MNLYRYMTFESFVDIVINQKLTLLSPDLWEDTFDGWLLKYMKQEIKEKFPKMQKLSENIYDSIFAQCWTKNSDSIVLWNIYSYDKKAIMVQTTKQELENLNVIIKEINYEKGAPVSINFFVDFILDKELEKMIEPLTVKRPGFEYEKESRIFGFASPKPNCCKSLDISIPNIHDFIKGVVVHPLAQEWYVNIVKSFCEYFDIPFNGKSDLYNFECLENDEV